MALIEINRHTCQQDGICAAVCPSGIIDFRKGDYPSLSHDAESVCIRCGHCVAACPTGSLTHREMPVDMCPPIDRDLHLSEARCEQFLRSRRSIRTFKSESVSREHMARLIELARYAPSGHNAQCVRWHVIDDKEALQGFSAKIADWMQWMIENMPDFAILMHMDRTLKRWQTGKDVFLRDAPAVVVAHAEKDNRLAPAACTIALTYMELAATAIGLGCCWAGYFNAAATTFPPMAAALALPEGHQSFGAMMVGYPRYAYHRMPLRNPPVVTWHGE